MLIPDAFLITEIRETDDFKKYETVFMKVAVPIIQPQPVGSTQGTNRNTPRAHRSPIVSANHLEKKKRKQTTKVSSLPRKIIKQKKQSTPSIPPPRDDRERDAIAEATLLSLTLHKTALLAEAQENIAKVQEKLIRRRLIRWLKEIEPGSQKENPEHVSDDDESEKEKETTEEVVKETEVANVSGSQETRNEQMQTPIFSPIRSPRKLTRIEKSLLIQLLNLYPKTSSSTTSTSSADLQQQLYLNMKAKPQDQAADPEIWEILKAKFEKP
ncbi:hypothetical protein Tco_0434625 [Tanacetum coccineum]